MLPKESGDGNRKCPFQFIVDHRISPGELFPRCQKIENGNRGNPRFGQWQNDMKVHSKNTTAVHIRRFIKFGRHALHKSFDHEGRIRNDPGDIEGD